MYLPNLLIGGWELGLRPLPRGARGFVSAACSPCVPRRAACSRRRRSMRPARRAPRAPRGVVVAHGLGVAKGLQQRVGLEHALLHGRARGVARGHRRCRRRGLLVALRVQAEGGGRFRSEGGRFRSEGCSSAARGAGSSVPCAAWCAHRRRRRRPALALAAVSPVTRPLRHPSPPYHPVTHPEVRQVLHDQLAGLGLAGARLASDLAGDRGVRWGGGVAG
jgi:hypothetical protein